MSAPDALEAKVATIADPSVFGREALTLPDGAANLVLRCTAQFQTFAGMRMKDYFHPRLIHATYSPILSAAMKASCGISTLPNWRMRFLPSFCFSRSLRLRVTSPP